MNTRNNKEYTAEVSLPLNRSWPHISEAENPHLGAGSTTHVSINTKSKIIIRQQPPLGLEGCQSISEETKATDKEGPTVNRSAKPKILSAQLKQAVVKHDIKNPLPPPRPSKTLPKKYHPLPPDPEENCKLLPIRKSISQSHTFPMTERSQRQLCMKELNNVLGHSGVPHLKEEHELSCQPMEYQSKCLPFPSPSLVIDPSFLIDDRRFQRMEFRTNREKCSPERSPSPVNSSTCRQKQEHVYVNLQNQLLMKPAEKNPCGCNWYVGEYDRQEAEEALLRENCDGVFLVRDCSKKSREEPYVLVIFYGLKVYNIKVRFLEASQQYALGSGLRGEHKFESVEAIIEFHKRVPLILIDGKDKSGTLKEQCYLTYPLRTRRSNLT